MKKLIRVILSKLGYSINKIDKSPFIEEAYRMQRLLLKEIDKPIIFDVGAHRGETSNYYCSLIENCIVYSFEPSTESYQALVNNTIHNPQIKPFNLALGNSNKKTELNINSFSQTNSILPTHQLGPQTWGDGLLETKKTEQINLMTLDEFVRTQSIERIDLLKLDTQGSEYLVIEGAMQTLSKIKIIYTEIITMPTYDGQIEFDEFIKLMRLNNFELYNIYNQSLINGKLRQLDAIFINKTMNP